MRRKWRNLRALAITLVLILGFVAGWPNRIPKLVHAWPEPWASLALRVPDVQARLLAPFAPVAGAFGITTEDWPLFTGTGGTRYRMWVEAEGRQSRRWTLLYRAHDDEHAYRKGPLEYRRVLNLWNPHHSWIPDAYVPYTRWLASQVFREFPQFRVVRVRMEEVLIRGRGEGFEPTGHFVYESVVRRSEVAP